MTLPLWKFLAILVILFQTDAVQQNGEFESQLSRENAHLRLENLRLTDEITRLRQHNKSQNSKIDMLLMLVCSRSCNSAPPEQKTKVVSLELTLPSSCAEALRNGGQSGIYKLRLPASELIDLKPFYVYCLSDSDNGPAWTIVQRRKNGRIDFDRGWAEYKRGFGNINEEFFMGLEKLHALTVEPQELWVRLVNYDGEELNAKYDSFAVGNEFSKYTLEDVGLYNGNGGDYLTALKGAKFTTKDENNYNLQGGNCAVLKKGAWWYAGCEDGFATNLNGVYGKDKNKQGITWNKSQLLKYTFMAIRPKEFTNVNVT